MTTPEQVRARLEELGYPYHKDGQSELKIVLDTIAVEIRQIRNWVLSGQPRDFDIMSVIQDIIDDIDDAYRLTGEEPSHIVSHEETQDG